MDNKPLVLRKQDFIKSLSIIVNQSGLPAFMLSDILRNLLAELDKQERQEILQATKEWEEEKKNE